jgi:hypothetical protein
VGVISGGCGSAPDDEFCEQVCVGVNVGVSVGVIEGVRVDVGEEVFTNACKDVSFTGKLSNWNRGMTDDTIGSSTFFLVPLSSFR